MYKVKISKIIVFISVCCVLKFSQYLLFFITLVELLQQKMVIKVSMNKHKSRSKALKVAVGFSGKIIVF